MAIRQMLPKMLLILAILALVPGRIALATDEGDKPKTRANLTNKSSSTLPDGSVETRVYNRVTGSSTVTLTKPDGSSRTIVHNGENTWTTTNKDKSGNVISTETATSVGNGVYVSTKKDKDGNLISTETSKPNEKGGRTVTTTLPNGVKFIRNCETFDIYNPCPNVYDRALSNNQKKTAHPRIEGRPGTAPASGLISGAKGSVTKKVQTEALQKFKYKSQAQDLITGGKTKLNVRGSDLTTGQKSRVGVSTTKKLQTQVLQQIKSKPQVQNWGSSGASAGSSPQRYHRLH
jgi:hypothetical protein